jgi:hypothetical protein
MDVYIGLNYEWFHVVNVKYYRPVILINVTDQQVMCKKKNSITILMENPRTNIELVSAVFYFYFQDWPQTGTMGQVISKCTILYTADNKQNQESYPCILFLKGQILEEILVYLPTRPVEFLRELKYHFYPQRKGTCVVCMEDDVTLINVHQNSFNHEMCNSCLLKLKQHSCPMCREEIV